MGIILSYYHTKFKLSICKIHLGIFMFSNFSVLQQPSWVRLTTTFNQLQTYVQLRLSDSSIKIHS